MTSFVCLARRGAYNADHVATMDQLSLSCVEAEVLQLSRVYVLKYHCISIIWFNRQQSLTINSYQCETIELLKLLYRP